MNGAVVEAAAALLGVDLEGAVVCAGAPARRIEPGVHQDGRGIAVVIVRNGKIRIRCFEAPKVSLKFSVTADDAPIEVGFIDALRIDNDIEFALNPRLVGGGIDVRRHFGKFAHLNAVARLVGDNACALAVAFAVFRTAGFAAGNVREPLFGDIDVIVARWEGRMDGLAIFARITKLVRLADAVAARRDDAVFSRDFGTVIAARKRAFVIERMIEGFDIIARVGAEVVVVADIVSVDFSVPAERRFGSILTDAVGTRRPRGWTGVGDAFALDADQTDRGVIFIADDGVVVTTRRFLTAVIACARGRYALIGLAQIVIGACFFGDDAAFADGLGVRIGTADFVVGFVAYQTRIHTLCVVDANAVIGAGFRMARPVDAGSQDAVFAKSCRAFLRTVGIVRTIFARAAEEAGRKDDTERQSLNFHFETSKLSLYECACCMKGHAMTSYGGNHTKSTQGKRGRLGRRYAFARRMIFRKRHFRFWWG